MYKTDSNSDTNQSDDVFDENQQFIDKMGASVQENPKKEIHKNVAHMVIANPKYISKHHEPTPKLVAFPKRSTRSTNPIK